MRDFVSNLAGKLKDFLDYKHALGIKYDTCRVYLLELDGYNLEHGNRNTLTKEMTEGWAIWHAGKSESQDRSWIPPIREFGRYLQSIGEKDAYVLDDRFSIQHYHAEVYLMSTDEIRAFFRECDSYVLRTEVPGRPYVELIKAVMMQESGGKGSDPMQAAEGSFNKKYPHQPNGIKDPEYSIECGVQELKAALVSAEVENPLDMERIKLALQGYNFGNGYISWAKTNYGGYSYANAVEFSAMQAAKLGWEKYGDTQYPAHVLRYYPYGRAFTSGGNQAIVEVALTQLGNEGGQPYWNWYGFGGRVEWCACFASWCADQCGYLESGIIPKFSLCSDGVNWFKGKGQWRDKNYEPQAGDLIFFDWGSNGSIDHVGIVEKCENGTVYTVEGNSGDACKQQSYSVGNSSIYGYGVPVY